MNNLSEALHKSDFNAFLAQLAHAKLAKYLIDVENIHNDLAKPNITLSLLHYQYEQKSKSLGKIPYAYRTFAEHYHNYAMKCKATMRIRRKPGEIVEVD